MRLRHFGAWLKSQREERGIPQYALAADLRITQAHLSRLESGRAELRVSGFLQWADALEVGRRRWLEGFALLKADMTEK